MKQRSDRKEWLRIPLRTLERSTIGRFERIVAGRVTDRRTRRRHAVLITALAGVGLGAALGLPVAGLAGAPMPIVVLPAVLSGLCLGLAAVLAATGAFDVVIGAAIALASMALASGAALGGGVASPLLWLLLIAPLEARIAGHRTLFRFSFAVAGLAAAFVLGAQTLERADRGFEPLAALAAAAAGIGYLAFGLFRIRRSAAKARRVREAQSIEARLLESMPGEAVLRFLPDGSLVGSSDRARDWFGEPDADDRHPFLLSAVHVADRVRYLTAFGDIRSGAASTQCAVRLAKPDAQGFCEATLKLVAVRDPSNRLLSIVAVAQDVSTERRRIEELQDALIQARMTSEAKSNFLAMVSHELRTPLNAIIGFSDVLHQEFFGGFETPRQKEYVGLIRQSGEHLLAVVNGLLDISKIEAGRYELVVEPFDLGAVLQAAVSAVRGEADRKGLRVEIRNDCGPDEVVADRRAIQQILLNLLSNAVKFTDSGRITVSADRRGDDLRIAVADTGAGIAASELPQLGKPFSQGSAGLSRRYPGTGLGLSLVKGFAELHHGSMALTSEVGRGTTVDVSIRLDCDRLAGKQNENSERIVALKHAKTDEAVSPPLQSRRSA